MGIFRLRFKYVNYKEQDLSLSLYSKTKSIDGKVYVLSLVLYYYIKKVVVKWVVLK